jgi:hypothetical protein
MAATRYKWGVFIFLLAVALLPAMYIPYLQERHLLPQSADLNGAEHRVEWPGWSVDAWLQGKYQATMADYVRQYPPVRALLVRWKNQVAFDLFRISPNSRTVIGKEGQLFDIGYLNAYLGKNYIGDAAWEECATHFHTLKDHLAQQGKALLVLLPPGAPTIAPELLPHRYQIYPAGPTNRKAFLDRLQQERIPHIAFEHFRYDRQAGPFRIAPKHNLHWSHYAAAIAIDSAMKRMENLLGFATPQLDTDSLRSFTGSRKIGREMLTTLNLYREPAGELLAIPRLVFRADSTTRRPRVLVIGDSYYELPFHLGMTDGLFDASSRYWHYFDQEVTKGPPYKTAVNREPERLLQAIEACDIVLFVISETNLGACGFGFPAALAKALEGSNH